MTLFNARGFEHRDLTGGVIQNPFENPAVPLASIGLDNVFGQMSNSESGESVTMDTALAVPTFWRCVGLMSTVIAGCPVRSYRLESKEETFPPLLDPSNVDMMYTQFELWELVVVHLATWGNAYVQKIREGAGGGSGQITDLRPIDPARVTVKVDNGNKIFLVKRMKKDGTADGGSKPLVLTTFEVMHIPGMGYNGVTGLSTIALAKNTLGTAMSGDRLAGKFFRSGTQLSGIINVKAPLTDQNQADQIRNRWIARNGGVRNSAEVAVLDAETSFQPLTIEPEALQFLESRRWQTTEIARWFGIPPHLIGDVEKSTSWGTGIEEQNTGFVSYTVSGWTNRIEQRISREITPTTGQYSEFDLDRLMRGSMSERFAAYALAIQWGWITRAEARVKENMPPIDGLDVPLEPVNMMAGSIATQQFDPKATPLVPADAPKPIAPGAGPKMPGAQNPPGSKNQNIGRPK